MHRSANHILRMCLEGKITLALFPQSFAKCKSTWDSHPDLAVISELLGNNLHCQEDNQYTTNEDIFTDSDEEEPDISETDEKPQTSNKFTALASCIENE